APHRGGGSPPEAFNIATLIAHGGTWIELGFDGTPTAVSLALDGPPRTSSRAWPTSPSNRSRWTDRIPTGEPPHAPQGQPRDAELPDLRPPVALVDVPRARMGGLEIAREAVAFGQRERVPGQASTVTAALVLRVHAEHLAIPERLGHVPQRRRLGGFGDPEQARRRGHADAKRHRAEPRPQDASPHRRHVAGQPPDRDPLAPGRRPDAAVSQAVAQHAG